MRKITSMSRSEILDVYPEHKKLVAIADQSQAVGDFVIHGKYVLAYWSSEDGCDDEDCVSSHPHLIAETAPIVEVLAQHYGIDMKVINQEKADMLLRVMGHHVSEEP